MNRFTYFPTREVKDNSVIYFDVYHKNVANRI